MFVNELADGTRVGACTICIIVYKSDKGKVLCVYGTKPKGELFSSVVR